MKLDILVKTFKIIFNMTHEIKNMENEKINKY